MPLVSSPGFSTTCISRSQTWLAPARPRIEKLQALEPGARAAIFTTSGRTTLDFTDDRDVLHKTLLRIRPAPSIARGIADCPDIEYYQADLIVNKNDPQALQVGEAEYVSVQPPASELHGGAMRWQ